MAVPVAGPYNRPGADAGLGKPSAFIPVPPKRGVEFRFQKFLNEAANPAPSPVSKGSNQSSPRKSVPSAASAGDFMLSVFMA